MVNCFELSCERKNYFTMEKLSTIKNLFIKGFPRVPIKFQSSKLSSFTVPHYIFFMKTLIIRSEISFSITWSCPLTDSGTIFKSGRRSSACSPMHVRASPSVIPSLCSSSSVLEEPR